MASTLCATSDSSGILLNGEQLLSPSAKGWLTIQDDGNLVVYRRVLDGTLIPVWSSGQSYQRNGRYFCAMQPDGNLVVYYGNVDWPKKIPIWSSNTGGHKHGEFVLSIDDNLNISIHRGTPSACKERVWSNVQ